MKSNLINIISTNKKLFIIIGICLFLLELEIFAVAVLKSGKQKTTQVFNRKGEIIYEADGKNLTDFNKYYFEKNFGPLENYDVKLNIKDVPFPFRAWFSAAICVPIGIVLLIAFILRSFQSLFTDHKQTDTSQQIDSKPIENETKIEGIIRRLSEINIFTIGGIIFLVSLSYWVLPNAIAYIGKIGFDAIYKFRWFLLVAGILITIIGVWFIYLRYLLAKKTLESKAEVEKHKLQLAYEHHDPQLQLEFKKDTDQNSDTVDAQILSEK